MSGDFPALSLAGPTRFPGSISKGCPPGRGLRQSSGVFGNSHELDGGQSSLAGISGSEAKSGR